MAAPLNDYNQSFFHSNSSLTPPNAVSQGKAKTKRFKSASSIAPEVPLPLSSEEAESFRQSLTSTFSSPIFKYQPTLDKDSPLKAKERLYIGKPLEKIFKLSLSEAELEAQASLARKNATEKQVPELFEKGFPQLLRQLGKVDLLEKFFTSSPYPQAFVQGFIKIELHCHTLFQTFISFMEFEARRAESPMHFRGNGFCVAVFKTHYLMKLTPQLEQLRQTVLKLRKEKLPKSFLGQLTTAHPSFLPILTETIREIHQSFDTLPEGFVYLLQVRFRSVYNYFPDHALRIAGDPFFLRLLNPYLTHPNGLSSSELNDIVQIARGLQKVVNGEYFEKCEGDIDAINLALAPLIKTHRIFVNQRLAPHSYFR